MIYTLIVCPYYLSLSVADNHLVDIFSVLVGVVERESYSVVDRDKARIANNGNHNIFHTYSPSVTLHLILLCFVVALVF